MEIVQGMTTHFALSDDVLKFSTIGFSSGTSYIGNRTLCSADICLFGSETAQQQCTWNYSLTCICCGIVPSVCLCPLKLVFYRKKRFPDWVRLHVCELCVVCLTFQMLFQTAHFTLFYKKKRFPDWVRLCELCVLCLAFQLLFQAAHFALEPWCSFLINSLVAACTACTAWRKTGWPVTLKPHPVSDLAFP